MSQEIDQVDALFKGRVQGVGFRHTAKQMAGRLSLVGFVRNLDDGSVEIMAQGPKKALQELIDQLKALFEIKSCQTTFSLQTKRYASFQII